MRECEKPEISKKNSNDEIIWIEDNSRKIKLDEGDGLLIRRNKRRN